jgi:hypothetical protein
MDCEIVDKIAEPEQEEEEAIEKVIDDFNETIPDSTKEASFSIDNDDDIPDDDIKRMLFLFCVNEDIPLHYKQLLGKVIKKDKYKKNEKLFIFNMIGYVWKLAREEKDLTKTQKVIIVRRIHKFMFGTFDD